uniref:Uncharacterized protein n=1 Tax=Arundo donax TaxID=35708 RepID=A0A0A8ZFN7_ARUDO
MTFKAMSLITVTPITSSSLLIPSANIIPIASPWPLIEFRWIFYRKKHMRRSMKRRRRFG